MKNNMKLDQIVKIAMMQSDASKTSAARCLLLYKENSNEGNGATPITDIDFKVYPTKKPWGTSLKAARADIESNDKRVVDFIQFPRQLGGDKFQVLFWIPKSVEAQVESFQIKHI